MPKYKPPSASSKQNKGEGKIRKDASKQQFYDLEVDPARTTNVIRQHADVASEIRTSLQTYRIHARTRK